MKNLLIKEMKLAASPLSFIFIAFAAMAIIPNYPILVGAFFVCFGIFHSFQSSREANDILYTILLPIKKTDAVKAKYAFTVMIQMVSLVFFGGFSILRMTVLKDAVAYQKNALMNANPVYLAFVLLVFVVFNTVFLGGFFKTAYKFGMPFIGFGIVAFVVITIAEVLHHIPGLEWMSAADISDIKSWIILAVAVVIYVCVTLLSCKISMKNFSEVDM